MNKNRYLIHWFLCVGVFFVLFILFVGLKLSSGEIKTSFFSNISEIAANEEYVYILDDRNTTLSAYKNNGDFVWCTNFSSTGDNRIFCDANGSICRYDVRKRTVWVYDEQGIESNSYKASHKELINNGTIDKYKQKSIEISGTNDVKYVLQKNIFADSTISVSRGGETNTRFVVESWESHVIWYIIIIALILIMLYGVYNLVCFIFHQYGLMGILKK